MGGCHCRSTLHQHRNEEEPVWTDPEQPRRDRNTGSEEHWSVHHSWRLQDQNPCQASNKGREEGSLRKSGDGESKASKKSGQGIPCFRLEKECLRRLRGKIQISTCICGASHRASEQAK